MPLNPRSVDFKKVCGRVLVGVDQMIDPQGGHGSITAREYQYMFQDVYQLCQPDVPARIKLYETLKQHFEMRATEFHCKIVASSSTDLLKAYNDTFIEFYEGAGYTCEAFRYLNSLTQPKQGQSAHGGAFRKPPLGGRGASERFGSAAVSSAGAPMLQVKALALACWRDKVYTPLWPKMLHGIIKEIQADRKGEASRLNVVQTSIDTLIKMDELEEDILKHYVSSFEETLLYQTAAHYDVHCSQYLGDNDCSSYMIMASAKLEEEETRGRQILHPTTYPKLKATMEETVVDKHKTMMQEECINFLEREQVADIERLYLLLRRVDGGIDPILQTFEEFVVSEGTKGIQALSVDPRRIGPKDYTDYVELITALHARFSKLVAGPFHDDSLSVVSLDKACRSIINSKSKTLPLSIPELLAKFVDACLKRSSKAGSDEEIEAKQVRAIFVFKYIDDKDMFQKIYSKMLAKRLIHGNSISEEAEASMISKLKQRCGYEYTVKLQKMFTDITLSSNLNTRFGGTEVGGALPFNLKMLVLQSGAWPVQSSTSTFMLPPELEKCIKLFGKFYEAMHSGRKLNWLHHLSTADVKSRIGKKPYEFGVTAYQMAVLLMFNAGGEVPPVYTVSEIRDATNLTEKELQRTVRSLVSAHVLKAEVPAAGGDGAEQSGGGSGGGSGGSGGGGGAAAAGADETGMEVAKTMSAPEMESGGTSSPSKPSIRRSHSSSSASGNSGPQPLDDECVISVNLAYSNKKKKVKLSGTVQRETPQESKQLRDSLNEDRRFFLQAVAVRVMKTRKTLAHMMLVKEIIDQAVVRFKPSVVAIKRCIEELIEKQYLERSPEDKHILLYIA